MKSVVHPELQEWALIWKEANKERKIKNRRAWKRCVDMKRVWLPNNPEMKGFKIGDLVEFYLGKKIATTCKIGVSDLWVEKESDCNRLMPMISYTKRLGVVVLKPIHGDWNWGEYCAAYLQNIPHFPFSNIRASIAVETT